MAALFSTWKKAGSEVIVKQVSSPQALNKEWKKKEIAYVKMLADQREKFATAVGEVYNDASDEGKALLRSPSVDAVKKNPALVQDLVKQLGSRAVPGFRFLDANINKFSSGADTSGSVTAAFGLIKGLVPAEVPVAADAAAEAMASVKVEDTNSAPATEIAAGESAAGAKELAPEGVAEAAGLEMKDNAPAYQRQKSIHDDYVAIDQDTIALFLQSHGDEEEGGEEGAKTPDVTKKALVASAAAIAAGAGGISAVVKSPGVAPTPSSTPTGTADGPAVAALPSPTSSSPIVDATSSLSAAAAAALNELPTPLAELGSDAPPAAASVTETLSGKVESTVASAKESITSSAVQAAQDLKETLSAPGGPSLDAAVDSLSSSASTAAESLKGSLSKSASPAVASADTSATPVQADVTLPPSSADVLAPAAAAEAPATPEKPRTLLDLAPPSDLLSATGSNLLEKEVAASAPEATQVVSDVASSAVEAGAGTATLEEKKVAEVLETAGTASTTVEAASEAGAPATIAATDTKTETGAESAPGESSPSVQAIIKKLQGGTGVASPAAAIEAAAPVIEDVAAKAGLSSATTEKGIQGVKSVVAKFEEVSKSAGTSPALKPLASPDVAVESIEGAATAVTDAAPGAGGEAAAPAGASATEEGKASETDPSAAGAVVTEAAAVEGAAKTEAAEEKTTGTETTETANAKTEDAKTEAAAAAPAKHKRTPSLNFIMRFLKEEAAKSQPPVIVEVGKENENLNPIVPPRAHRRSGSLAIFGCFSKSKTLE